MFTIFKKLFGKAAPKPAPPVVIPPPAPTAPMPTIEVAHLSLAAITARFPDELKSLLAREPDPGATVALPFPTILKQLPAGCVKMSLATLQRQAHGLITPLPLGDKRMVDVPLAEIFRHLPTRSLKRRADQRPMFVPESGYNLFGDAANPYAVAPDDHLEQVQMVDLTEAAQEVAPQPSSSQRVLKMDDGLREHFENASPSRPAVAVVEPAPAMRFELAESGPRMVAAEPEGAVVETPAAPTIPKPEGPTLNLDVASLAAAWPNDIRQELADLDPATVVTLPLPEVATALAKGRVSFSWGQLRAWLAPNPGAPTVADADTALQLPLKIVAPAFLAATRKPRPERKDFELDESIPALFTSSRQPEPPPEPDAPATEVAPEPAAAAPVADRISETVGEIFGEPQKRDWTPAEIVAHTAKLPGVSGAIVALQEGLQVASVLPDGVKSEVIAAFLPQIFARLNQYSGEMKLGEVDDLLFTTHGAHCQIYRLGYVYLAVLGRPGEPLPWHELRLISEELARQTHT